MFQTYLSMKMERRKFFKSGIKGVIAAGLLPTISCNTPKNAISSNQEQWLDLGKGKKANSAREKNLSCDVAVIGGGSAGSTIAIRLAMAGIHVHLIEKNPSLINAPPMCHLHAGGNLYREISDEDCRMLMRQCIDIAKLYPESIDVRPTLITVPKRDNSTATDLLPRLDMLTAYYQSLVDADPSNQVLGKVQDYYRVYDKPQIQQLIQLAAKDIPTTTDEWVVAALKVMDLEKLQYPIIAVQEFGWNIFRLSASAFLQLQRLVVVAVASQGKGAQRCPSEGFVHPQPLDVAVGVHSYQHARRCIPPSYPTIPLRQTMPSENSQVDF